MATIAPAGFQDDDLEQTEAVVVPLTPAQIAAVKAANPPLSPWWVVLSQIIVGLLASVLAWGFFGGAAARSLVWGVVAVVFPAAIFARGLTSRFAQANVGAAVMSFFLWELVKMVMTVGLLMAAHRWVTDLSWPAMLVGLLVTVKVYWLALAFRRKGRSAQVSAIKQSN